MNGWQEPNDGKRIYLITDNTKMDGFTDYIKPEDIEHLYVTYSESRVNLGIHYYRNSLYSSNLVGICRIKSVDDETLYDAEGNELLIKVVPRFNVTVVELLNYKGMTMSLTGTWLRRQLVTGIKKRILRQLTEMRFSIFSRMRNH